MSDQPSPQKNRVQLSNLSVGNVLVIFSGLLFFVSLFFNWTEYDYGMVITSKGYEYIDFYVSKSGWPNLVPLSLMAAIGCILLCIPFLKPLDMDRIKEYLIFVNVQIALSILGIHGILILWSIQLPSFKGRFLFGAWLGLISMAGQIYGSFKTRSELL